MKKALTSGLVLLILGIVCGTVLAVVNFFTARIIEEREIAESKATLAEFGINLDEYDQDLQKKISSNIDKAIYLSQNGDLKIAVYTVIGSGYSSGLKMMIVVDENMEVLGYSVLAHNETAGIGADVLESHDYNMVGAILPDLSQFDATSSPTAPITNTGVRNCFIVAGTRAAIDFGGGQ
ncbi:MAG TPA: FMN-binding protein [Candidatus Izemoplasmatales bacterium]|nr:FMN-binding protein [Bacillota bacterium]HRY77739.1 FMN-binding protein [Candidatus Izemoplasmatales bacterium]